MMNLNQENNIKTEQKDSEETSSNESISQPFDPKKIDITTKQMILEAIFRRLRNEEIDLYPSFQRKPDLWDKTRQSRLIESILISLPLPAFYFDGSDDDKWQIVDGLQRISTFKNYIIDGTLKLQNLEYLTQFNGVCFENLPRPLQRRLEEHEVTVYIINPGTPNEVKFNLFRRINTGGLQLEPQEIRNAVYQGIPANFVAQLAALDEFTQYGINPNRMLDKDFVTRFIAFYIYQPSEYEPDLDTFLNKVMEHLETLSEQQRTQIQKDFQKALRAAKALFGNDAFTRNLQAATNKKNPINKALFEIWTTALARLDNDMIDKLIAKKDNLNTAMHLLDTDKEFEKAISGSTANKNYLIKRFETITKLIAEVLT